MSFNVKMYLMIKIIHSSILCKWGKPTKSARDQIIIAPTVCSQ